MQRFDIDIYQGATFRLNATWADPAGDPIDMTGYLARMQIRQTYDANTPLISLTESSGIALGGGRWCRRGRDHGGSDRGASDFAHQRYSADGAVLLRPRSRGARRHGDPHGERRRSPMRVPATHIIARLSPTTRVEVRQSTVEASRDGFSVSMPVLDVTQLGNP